MKTKWKVTFKEKVPAGLLDVWAWVLITVEDQAAAQNLAIEQVGTTAINVESVTKWEQGS